MAGIIKKKNKRSDSILKKINCFKIIKHMCFKIFTSLDIDKENQKHAKGKK